MSIPTLQEIALKLDEIADEIWRCDDLDNGFDDAHQRFSRLQAQLHVQKSLRKTAKLLREEMYDKALPKQHATRIKHFIKFTFEKTLRSNERSTRLRKLECNALKLCGLTYTIKEILELPAPQFDFLLANATNFVYHNKLAHHLYRDDINKFIFGKFDPEDDALFKGFLKSHIEHRPSKRKSDDATENEIPSSLPITVGSQGDKQPVKHLRTSKTTDSTNITPPNETQSELTAERGISSTNPNFTTGREQEVFENASLRGIAKVLDEYMCDEIRRVTGDSDLKAAVTMVFPGWAGPVHCLMSLEVGEVEHLAMALFNAEVKWVDQVLHVALNEGITLIVPNSEATLKGVPDEAIVKVFGTKIHDAITECPVRWRELAEGKHLTECVSMIVTKSGAIINLSLGLDRGLEIRNMLYS